MSGALAGVGGLTPPLERADDEVAPPRAAEAPPPVADRQQRGGAPGGRESVLASLARHVTPEAPAPDASRLDAPAPPFGGLPEVLLEAGSAVVVHGDDPGDFYCEHLFYVSQLEAARAGSTVLANADGERLVGFLHVPADAHTYGGAAGYAQAERHAGTREVVGAALRGYFEEATDAGAGDPVRILLTGYDTFREVVDNPTADFVTHPENLDAALRVAFGDRLLGVAAEASSPEDAAAGCPSPGPTGAGASPASSASPASPPPPPVPAQVPDARVVAYRVLDASGRERRLEVQLRRYPVADAALDPGDPRSVQQAMRGFRPHAVLSMGVSGSAAHHLAEHHADAGRLREDEGRWVHDERKAPDRGLADNYSLARAILRGGAARPG